MPLNRKHSVSDLVTYPWGPWSPLGCLGRTQSELARTLLAQSRCRVLLRAHLPPTRPHRSLTPSTWHPIGGQHHWWPSDLHARDAADERNLHIEYTCNSPGRSLTCVDAMIVTSGADLFRVWSFIFEQTVQFGGSLGLVSSQWNQLW